MKRFVIRCYENEFSASRYESSTLIGRKFIVVYEQEI